MVVRSRSKDRPSSENKLIKGVSIVGGTVKSVKHAHEDHSRLSFSSNNLLKVNEIDKTSFVATTKPTVESKNFDHNHCTSLGSKISRSIYDLTSVERLKRWKAKLPSVRNKQQQQKRREDDNDIGKKNSSGTNGFDGDEDVKKIASGEKVDTVIAVCEKTSSCENSNSTSSKQQTVVDLPSITTTLNVSSSSSIALAPVESFNRFQNTTEELSRLTTRSNDNDDDQRRNSEERKQFVKRFAIGNNNMAERNKKFEQLASNHLSSNSNNNLLTTNSKQIIINRRMVDSNNYSSSLKLKKNNNNNISSTNNHRTSTNIKNSTNSSITAIEIELDKNKSNNNCTTTKTKNNNQNDDYFDVYEELDCCKSITDNDHLVIPSPVKLAPSGEILNEVIIYRVNNKFCIRLLQIVKVPLLRLAPLFLTAKCNLIANLYTLYCTA